MHKSVGTWAVIYVGGGGAEGRSPPVPPEGLHPGEIK